MSSFQPRNRVGVTNKTLVYFCFIIITIIRRTHPHASFMNFMNHHRQLAFKGVSPSSSGNGPSLTFAEWRRCPEPGCAVCCPFNPAVALPTTTCRFCFCSRHHLSTGVFLHTHLITIMAHHANPCCRVPALISESFGVKAWLSVWSFKVI